MNNSTIELEMIHKYGMDATIKFCDMVSFMYDLLYRDSLIRNKELNEEFAYDYERDWWRDKYVELTERLHNELT